MSSSIYPINNVLSDIQQSLYRSPLLTSLYRLNAQQASTATTAKTQAQLDKLLIVGNRSVQFSSTDLKQLIDKINPEGVSYLELKNANPATLRGQQAELLKFLVDNPQYFKQIAALDQKPNVVTKQDVNLLAQLVSEVQVSATTANTNTNATRNTTTQATPTTTNTTATSTTLPPTAPNETRAISALGTDTFVQNAAQPPSNTLSTGPVNYGLASYNEISQALARRPINTPSNVNNLPEEQPQNQLPSALSILLQQQRFIDPSRIELAKAAAAYNNPIKRKDEKTPPRRVGIVNDKVTEVFETEALDVSNYIKPFIHFEQHVSLNGDDIATLLHAINPDDEVTLEELRHYETNNPKMQSILSVLKQLEVFEELAKLDHHDNTLSAKDIKLACTAGGEFVLNDGHLTLVITSKSNKKS